MELDRDEMARQQGFYRRHVQMKALWKHEKGILFHTYDILGAERYSSDKMHPYRYHSTKKSVTTMLTYPWKCTVLHCNHLGNSQSVRSSAPVVSRCFPGGYNVKLYISRGRLAWWLLTFLHSVSNR